MRDRASILIWLAALSIGIACNVVEEPDTPIVGTWVIDEAAQREEIARVSPDELEDFDEKFPRTLGAIRETFHADGRYEVTNALGGPYLDQWEAVESRDDSITIRSSGHSWVAYQSRIGHRDARRSESTLTYEFDDADHMHVKIDTRIHDAPTALSFHFVRVD